VLKSQNEQLSLHSTLYSKIPENHILRLINNAIDLDYITAKLRKHYNEFYGRPAKQPEMLIRILILKHLYDLSDEAVIEQCEYNLAYKWFVGLNPEEDLPESSLLTKFRKKKLAGTELDDILCEVVRQCVDKGIIKDTRMSIDCTHTHANTVKKIPERIMKRLAEKILKNIEIETGSIPEDINTEIPNYKEIEDHKVAKETMKNYVEELIDSVEYQIDTSSAPQTLQAIEKAKEILSDPKFMEQKGLRSLVDEDARVGNKTKTDSFFGYKVELAMLPQDGIITAVNVHDGAYVDGTDFKGLYNQTKESGITIKECYGDKAYFRQAILEQLESNNVDIYIPVSEAVYKMDETKFRYNKDSDQWFCEMGNCTVSKKSTVRKKQGREYKYLWYYFEKEKCRNCPIRSECVKGTRVARALEISVNTPKYYGYSQREKTEEFKVKYKIRARHEGKNAELKRFHGMDRAKGYGLSSMLIQAKLTALAANLKRITKLVSSLSNAILHIVVIRGDSLSIAWDF